MHAVTDCLVRWMVKNDMSEILDIEQRSFDFAWTRDDFMNYLRQRNCIGFVAESENQVIGFFLYRLTSKAVHLLNFAVDPSFRRLSVGQQMIEKLLRLLSHRKRTEIQLEVRELNLGAQLFFRSMGFVATSVLRDHYEDTDEDAYVMKYTLPIDDWNR